MVTRVVHVITKGDVGGAQTHVRVLATLQRQVGHAVTVIAGTDGPAVQQLAADGIDTIVLESLGRATVVSPWSALHDLTASLRRIGPDVVHCHSSIGGLLGRIAARRVRCASVYTAHGWPFQRGAGLSQRVTSLAGELIGGRLGDGVICLTEAEAARGRRARVVRRDACWIVPNGLPDIAPEHRRPARGPGAVRLMMVARFAPPKLQSAVIDALACVPDSDWTVTFVGDGPDLDVCRRSAAERLGHRAIFLGARDDVEALLPTADVLILWSRYEGQPMSLLEGMRAGVCCVGNALPGVVELFGADGGLVAQDDAELVQLVGSLVADRTRCDEIGAGARRRYEQTYTGVRMERGVDRVYTAVRHRHRASESSRLPPG